MVNRTEPGTVLTDRRPDGAALTIRRRPEERGERGERGERDGGRSE
ncbi:hypothetical protein [Streptomyces sp. NPDC059455]